MTYRPYRSIVRMPKRMPELKAMLEDIGSPHPRELAKALRVTERTVWRWLGDGKAPHTAMLAIYWLTRWGVSEIDCEAHNAASMSASMARSFKDELEALRAQVERIGRIGSFGSSNDPAPGVVPLVSLPTSAPIVPKNTVEEPLEPSSPEQLKTELNPISMRVSAS